MTFPKSQKREQFIQDVIRRKQWLAILPHPIHRGRMIWITPYKVGKPAAGIYKNGHVQRP